MAETIVITSSPPCHQSDPLPTPTLHSIPAKIHHNASAKVDTYFLISSENGRDLLRVRLARNGLELTVMRLM